MSDDKIERAALGRIYELGALYDARSDSFCGIPMFKRGIPASTVTTTDNNHTDMKFIIGDNLSEKFRKLDVSAELSMSVLGGLLQMDGSAKYLDTKKESRRSGQASLLYNIMTKVEKLNLFSDELTACISHDALSHGTATHVVVEVYWGANSLVTVKDENSDNEDKKEIEGHLNATLVKACLKISGKAGVEFEESEKARSKNYSFQIFGDVLTDKSQLMPSTIEDAIRMMQQIPALVQKANDGKGKPLKYGLFPISAKSFRDLLQLTQAANLMLRRLDNWVINDFVNLFNEIAQVSQEVHDIVHDIGEMDKKFKCVPAGTVKQLTEIRHRISSGESELRDRLAASLKNVRSGNGEMTDLRSLISIYRVSADCAEKLCEVCREKYKELSTKHEFAEKCQNNGVTYLTSLKDDLFDRGKVVVLYGSTEKAKADENRWTRNRIVFFNLANEYHNRQKEPVVAGSTAVKQFYYVDCDFDLPVTAKRKAIRIEKYRDGKRIDEDLACSINELICTDSITDDVVEHLTSGFEMEIQSLQTANVKIRIDKDKKCVRVKGGNELVKDTKKKVIGILKRQKEVFDSPEYIRMTKGTTEYLLAFGCRECTDFPPYWSSSACDSYCTSGKINRIELDKKSEVYKDVEKLIVGTWDASKVGRGQGAIGLSHSALVVRSVWQLEERTMFMMYDVSRKNLCRKAFAKLIPGIAGLKGEREVRTRKLGLKQLEKPNNLVSEINECYLLHACTKQSVDSIKRDGGLDFPGKSTGFTYGNGTYLAESSTKADQYADEKSNRVGPNQPLHMLVVRTLLGKVFVCQKLQKFSRPPCSVGSCMKDDCSDPRHAGFSFDSIIGAHKPTEADSATPRLLFREFVIFDQTQCYPEFLVEYERR